LVQASWLLLGQQVGCQLLLSSRSAVGTQGLLRLLLLL
jgi:hypothetical protein